VVLHGEEGIQNHIPLAGGLESLALHVVSEYGFVGNLHGSPPIEYEYHLPLKSFRCQGEILLRLQSIKQQARD
jgi:hypothetical protein